MDTILYFPENVDGPKRIEIFTKSSRVRNWGLEKFNDFYIPYSEPGGVTTKLRFLIYSGVALLWYSALQIQFLNQ